RARSGGRSRSHYRRRSHGKSGSHPSRKLPGGNSPRIVAGPAAVPRDGGDREDRTRRNATRHEHGYRYGYRRSSLKPGRAQGHVEDTSLRDRTDHPRQAHRHLSHMKIQPANRRLGILLSGRCSNFEAIADRVAEGKLNAEIAVVISNV